MMEEIAGNDIRDLSEQFTQVEIANEATSTSSTTSTNTPTLSASESAIQPEKQSRQFQPTTHQLEELGRVELSAVECARNFTEISARLRANLLAVSANSEKHMDAYKLTTENMQEQVNESLVAMHALITKCQELNVDFRRIHEMAGEIKAIRRDVDTLYGLIAEK